MRRILKVGGRVKTVVFNLYIFIGTILHKFVIQINICLIINKITI